MNEKESKFRAYKREDNRVSHVLVRIAGRDTTLMCGDMGSSLPAPDTALGAVTAISLIM